MTSTAAGSAASLRFHPKRDSPEAYRALAALTRAGGGDVRVGELVKIRASQLNGCAYCIDLHTAEARAAGETERRIYALSAWWEAPFFDDRERAALALTDALTLVAQRPVPEEVYAEAARHFAGPELATLVAGIAAINAWNVYTIASGAMPRVVPG
jgi:AhpD family alkylhydroperoxidase